MTLLSRPGLALLMLVVAAGFGGLRGQEAAGACALCGDEKEMTCLRCSGEGMIDEPCPRCEGTGSHACRECSTLIPGTIACPNPSCQSGTVTLRAKGSTRTWSCGICLGQGALPCGACLRGQVRCIACEGKGRQRRVCGDCGGGGHIRCPLCQLDPGSVRCAPCGDHGTRPCPRCAEGPQEPLRCGHCQGRGTLQCQHCVGTSRAACPHCHGLGWSQQGATGGRTRLSRCRDCNGRGVLDCTHCEGGRASCERCQHGVSTEQCPACDPGHAVTCGFCGGRNSLPTVPARYADHLDTLGKSAAARRLRQMQIRIEHRQGSRFGGDAASETPDGPREKVRDGRLLDVAVRQTQAGLDWLARHQSPSGAWQPRNFGTLCKGEAGTRCAHPGDTSDLLATSLSLLCFLGGGETHRQGNHTAAIATSLSWLLAQEEEGAWPGASGPVPWRDRACATLALVAACRLTGSPALRGPAARAVEQLLAEQREDGAWGSDEEYSPGDALATALAVEALGAAEAAGLRDPATAALARAGSFLGTQVEVLAAWSGDPSDRTLTGLAAAVYGLRLCSTEPLVAPMILHRALTMLAVRGPETTSDPVYLCLATLAMSETADDVWADWCTSLARHALSLQATEGCARGSWTHHEPGPGEPGRLVGTALLIYCAESVGRWARSPDPTN